MQDPAQLADERRSAPTAYAAYCALLAAAVLGAAVWFVSDVGANDLWWHLAAGREFFAHRQVPRMDTLSFTFAGRPWTNHEWLWGVAAFALYRIDPEWLALANFALLALTFALTFESSVRVAYAPAAAVAACWLAASCTSFFSDIRPHLVTLLCTSLLLATRDLRYAPWLWPGLLALWCNLHAGYLFGLGALGLLVLTRGVQLRLRGAHVSWTRRRWLAACAALLASGLAIGCNPWGFHLLDYVLSYAPGARRSLYAIELNEWQPLDFAWDELRFFGPGAWLATFRGRYACVLALAAVGVPRGLRRDPYVVGLGLTTVLMALRAQRFVELSVVVLAPLVATGLASLSHWLARPLQRFPQALRSRVPPWLLLCLVAWFWSDARLLPNVFERWTQPDLGPRAAVHYLAALGAPLRVLNFETWGGYISLHAPQTRIFMDGRSNTVYDDALYREYLDMMNGRVPLAPLLAKYRPDAALVPHIRIVDALRELPEPWVIAYQDQLAVLLLPPHSPLLTRMPNPERVLGEQPQWLRRKATLANQSGDTTAALALLQRALTRNPLYVTGYTDLMTMMAANGGLVAAEEVARMASRQLPERKRAFRRKLGELYEVYGKKRDAVTSYRAALVAGPFDSQRELQAHVEALEAALP